MSIDCVRHSEGQFLTRGRGLNRRRHGDSCDIETTTYGEMNVSRERSEQDHNDFGAPRTSGHSERERERERERCHKKIKQQRKYSTRRCCQQLLIGWRAAYGGGVSHHVGEPLVDGDAVVVERGRLEDDPRGADEHSQREDPEEQPVQHHGHVLPVFLHLPNKSAISTCYGGSRDKEFE